MSQSETQNEAGRVSEEELRTELHRHATNLVDMLVEWFGIEPSSQIKEGAADVTYMRLSRLLALRAADHPAVGVRPLEWGTMSGLGFFRAPSPIGEYVILSPLGMEPAKWWLGNTPRDPFTCNSVDAAKAAAFEHYRNAILSCIEPLRPATEQAGGEVVERVWQAVLACPHLMTGGEITLRYSAARPGLNASAQLRDRIEAALSNPGASQ